eukprot:746585-Hanusia_phi.AAC.1
MIHAHGGETFEEQEWCKREEEEEERRGGQSRAEQSRAEQNRTEQSRAEQNRAEQNDSKSSGMRRKWEICRLSPLDSTASGARIAVRQALDWL